MNNPKTIPRADQSGGERQTTSVALEPVEILNEILCVGNKLMAPFSVYLQHQYRISLNEFRLLMLIGQHENSASHELAAMTGVNVMSVSRAVSTLERHGRITTKRDPNNRRRKILALTDEGRKLYQLMREPTDRVAKFLLSDMRMDEIMAVHRHLKTMITTLDAKDDKGRSLFLERTRPRDDEASQ